MHSMLHKNKAFGKPKYAQDQTPIVFFPDFDQLTSLRRDTDYNDTFGYTPLFLAVHEGDLKLADSLLQENSVKKNLYGKTLIHIAAAKGYKQIICFLCSLNARVDVGDGDGNTPLHLAVKANHIDVVNLLLNENTINLKNHYDETPLHIAAEKGDIQLIEILLKNGANANVQDDEGKTPLHVAVQAKCPSLKIIELLFSHGATGDILCKNEDTPLFSAVSSENISVIKTLISHGASIDILNTNGKSPLVLAIKKKNEQIVKLLLTKDCSEKFEETNMMTPLHYSAQCGNEEIVKLLMTNGYGNVNSKNEDFKTPLYYAVVNGHLKVLEYLLQNGSIIESATSDKESLLHLCVTNNRMDILKCLIDHGAKVDIKTGQAETPLHFSISEDRLNIFEHLIQCGCDIHAKTLTGETPLYLAVKAGHVEMTEKLLDCGADINSLDRENCSALTLAVKSREPKILRLLLDKVDKKKWLISQSESSSEEKALHIASENGDDEIFKILLDVGCPFNTNWNGKNALHVAAMFGRRKSVELLIKAGADINSRTKTLETSLHLAAASGQSSVVKFLLDTGAKQDVKNGKYFLPLAYAFDAIQQQDDKQNYSTNYLKKTKILSRGGASYFLYVTPFMFEKYLQVTELLIKNYLVYNVSSWMDILEYACRIRVSYKNKMNFFPDIVRCILNYTNNLILMKLYLFNGVIRNAIVLNDPQLLDVLLEYDINKLCRNFFIEPAKINLKIILAVIDHNEDIVFFFVLLYAVPVQRTVLEFRNLNKFDQVFPLKEFWSEEGLIHKINQSGRIALNKNTYIDVLKLIVARLVLVRSVAKKSNVPGPIELKILENYHLSDWYRQCELQIMTMREAKVQHEFDLTYFDVLTSPVNRLANYVESKDFLKILQLTYQKFPAYAKFLERSVEKGMLRKDAIDSGADCLLNAILKNYNIQLPGLVIDKIFDYLSIRDLRKLETAGRFFKKPLYLRKIFSGKRR